MTIKNQYIEFKRLILNIKIYSSLYLNYKKNRNSFTERYYKLLNLIRPFKSEHTLVRIGPDSDGGYLAPSNVGDISLLISPGVSSKFQFDAQFCQLYNCKAILVDGSVSLSNLPDNLIFIKKFLSNLSTDSQVTLNGLINKYSNNSSDLALQMDIEGGEWDILYHLDKDSLSRFKILIIELHHLSNIFSNKHSKQLDVLEKIMTSHAPVHIHINNNYSLKNINGCYIPEDIEVTYIRRDIESSNLCEPPLFPNIMDRPCVENLPEVNIPEEWKLYWNSAL